jgi:aristolochene synthase
MRFVMKLELTPLELEYVIDVDMNCAKHISVVNDIHSWEKELRKSHASYEEGSILCSSVKVLSMECSVDYEASKRILHVMCKEWELVHLALSQQKKEGGARQVVLTYCRGLGYQMSGNEVWSRTTKRYHQM